MDLPDDTQLTEAGLAPARTGRILLIACGALAREILALKSRQWLGSHRPDLSAGDPAQPPRADHAGHRGRHRQAPRGL